MHDGEVAPTDGAQPTIGARLRAARQNRGLSLRAVAGATSISPTVLSQIETGRRAISATHLQEIAGALDHTIEEVVLTPVDGTRRPGPRILAPAPSTVGRPPVRDWRVYEPLDFDPVLAAALDLFVTTGYHGATVRDVARRCGMSVSGIYHYYPSKQDMLRRILELGVADLLERATLARGDGHDPVERFSLMIESLVLFHTHRREIGFVGASEMRSLDPDVRDRVAADRRQQQVMIDLEVTEAVELGIFTVPHPLEASRAVVTMCTSIVQWYNPMGQQTPATIAADYIGFALDVMRFGGRPSGAGVADPG